MSSRDANDPPADPEASVTAPSSPPASGRPARRRTRPAERDVAGAEASPEKGAASSAVVQVSDEVEAAAEADQTPRRRRAARATRSTADATVSETPRAAAPPAPSAAPRPFLLPERPRREGRGGHDRGRDRDRDDEPRGEPVRSDGPKKHAAVRHAVPLDEARIDPDVQKVVKRLVRNGYEAYLVGGCVRDLLLERRPKDFDVATSARPEEVRELFRNSRVIGRRFRLVHVLFGGGKVIEVATFRRNPNEEGDVDARDEDGDPIEPSTLLIRSDNVFGDAHEDALRRDFTINGLFYDLEEGEILDWVGGLGDVRGRVVNTIGDPVLRFREDPVRILRALKFAGRLDLGIRPSVYDAIVQCRDALDLAARPRLAEEILRLLRGGEARRTVFLAWETGILDVLLPELATLLYDSFSGSDRPTPGGKAPARSPGERVFRLLEHIDRRTEADGPLDDTVLWTVLLLEPLKEAVDGARDRAVAVGDFLEPLIERLAIPRRFADGMRRILAVLPRMIAGKAGRFARTELFDLALEVAEADITARGLPAEAVRALRAGVAAERGKAAPPRAHAPGARVPARPRPVTPRP